MVIYIILIKKHKKLTLFLQIYILTNTKKPEPTYKNWTQVEIKLYRACAAVINASL